MDKQSINHKKLLLKVVGAFTANNMTNEPDNEIYYTKLSRDADACHFILHGLTTYPMKIKTAYAENQSSNQADGYVTKIKRVKDDVLFIHDGHGWKKQSYLWALYDIGDVIGKENVLNLSQFEAWLTTKLREKKTAN
jgi:hypothetical protein